MNLFGIFSQIEKTDPEAAEKVSFSRRKLLKTTSVAAAATPLFFAASINKAFADTPSVVDILKYALTLEYLERDFYRAAQFSRGLLPLGTREYVVQIAKHEASHVDLLRGAIPEAQTIKENTLKFDFTYGGAFPDVLTNYQTFLAIAQALEDTGVRAYKGQAANLLSDPTVLGIALQIHSVEARHAAAVRRMRGIRVWPDANDNTLPTSPNVQGAVYAGENQTMQPNGGGGMVDLMTLPHDSVFNPAMYERTVYESFDEPLTMEQVLAIAGPFIKS
ncbi:ferritin-like domain-containing protein [Larkinella soli]|uniref:ferritin-like domain-containing protein n=1 Tax=Larkinella soli TaxID=1770527 RepID=UPI000FFCA583|nr:ferritin-like domain-containing protein [Larkinella soli]